MELVVAMARMYGAPTLTSVTRVHIDAVIYIGPATLAFARHFAALGARFAVPTTLNAVSAPREWEALGVPPAEAEPALALPEAYESLGADGSSRTCAPYFLPSPPAVGESVGWAESNAVIYANSVLGARTLKYPDMLDVAVALTGRAPLAGTHVDAARAPRIRVDVEFEGGREPGGLFWPLLGYCVGTEAGHDVVVVCGLEDSKPRQSDLKAFGAAFGTSSGSPMFHIRGVTPEAPAHAEFDVDRSVAIRKAELAAAWEGLNSARGEDVGLVGLGNPHLAVDEFGEIAELVQPLLARGLRAEVPLMLTAGRHVASEAEKRGFLEPLRRFGATVVEDACWCMINSPVVPDLAQSVATNSAKYAHYGPGGIGKPMYFASTAECIQAAVSARCARELPSWLA
jgi:predicted aconitase